MIETLPNIPRLYTALAEWCSCIFYIMLYRRRIKGIKLWLTVIGSFWVQSVFMVLTGSLQLQFWMLCMAIAVGNMYLTTCLCSEMTGTAAGYCTVRAFILAEFMASLAWQIYLEVFYLRGMNSRWISGVCVLTVYALVLVLMYRIENWHPNRLDILTVESRDFWPTALISLSVFFASNMGFVPFKTTLEPEAWKQIYKTRTLVDFAGVVLLFAHHIQRSALHIRQEYDAIQNVLQNQYAQYRMSKESIDLINRKYHDLKHQISVLRAESDQQRQTEYLDEMEQEIRDYEAQNKTGNSVLDTVLTGKSLYCIRKNIKLTCVADGSLLEDMQVMDICTIFGNALENAIECEKKILDPEKRMISLALFSRKDFIVIRIENYFEGKLDFQEGLPVTTKKETDYHGYGMKSIRYTVEKYGGNVTVHVHDNWFELDIIIPKKK